MFYKTSFVITMTLWWCNLLRMFAKCCNVRYVMLNYCDLGCMQVGLKSVVILVDYRVYMGASSRIWSFRRLFSYLYSYKLVGSVTCTVCAKRTIGSDILLDAPNGTPSWRGSCGISFGPFGDSANLDARSLHGLRRTYHRLGNRFGRTRLNS